MNAHAPIPVVDFPCPCIACGYDVVGIPLHERCPECGTRIRKSYQGPTLDRCDPGWVRRLANGQRQLAWACALWSAGTLLLGVYVLMLVAQAFVNWRSLSTIAVFTIGPCLVLGFTLLVSGGVLVTTRERSDAEALPQRVTFRWLLGVIVVIGGVMGGIALVVPLGGPSKRLPLMVLDGLLIALGSAALVLAVTGAAYLARVAVRVPDAKLGARLLQSARTLALLAGLGAICSIPGQFKTFRWSDPNDRPFMLAFGVVVLLVLLSGVWLSTLMLRLSRRLRAVVRVDRPPRYSAYMPTTEGLSLCLTCGFDNRRLPDGLPCPECGTEHLWASGGPGFSDTDPRWRAKVIRGHRQLFLALLVCALACTGFGFVEWYFLQLSNGTLLTIGFEAIDAIHKVSYIMLVIALFLAFLGARRISSRETEGPGMRRSATWLRLSALVALLSSSVVIALEQRFFSSILPLWVLSVFYELHLAVLLLSLASGTWMVLHTTLFLTRLTTRFRGPLAARHQRIVGLVCAGLLLVSFGVAEGSYYLAYLSPLIVVSLVAAWAYTSAALFSVLLAVVMLHAGRGLRRLA